MHDDCPSQLAQALLVDVANTGLGLVPQPNPNIRAEMTSFSFNYTFWLNLIFGALAAYLFWLSRKYPMHHGHDHHGEGEGGVRHHLITRRNHLERRPMRARILMAALAAMPAAASAHADTPASPYAGQQTRAIKALSPEDIDELRKGAGMGLAKAAELNGYPGPLHVLALAKELRLTPGQMRQVTDIRERMSAAAKPLGGEIIDREQELDGLFAQGQITTERLWAETAAIGALQGRLRSVHLAAHLETRDVLTPEQLAGYRQLRGYGDQTATPHHHPPG